MRPTILPFPHVFVVAGTCLPSHCLSVIGDTNTDAQTDGRDL
jgi:hypothetical protein